MPNPRPNPSRRPAVILARGLGTRMRAAADGLGLTPAQAAQAARGLKGMIPDAAGRPFLAHVLSALADGGVTAVCMVVAPDHAVVAEWLQAQPPQRVAVSLVVQPEPLGTADAVLAAADWMQGEETLVLNADNLYPADTIRQLLAVEGAATIAFDREALIRESNIDAARIAAFALLEVDAAGWLRGIIEKPTPEELAARPEARDISMNLWRVDAGLLAACRTVPRSVRGEFELPQAVAQAVAAGHRVRVLRHAGGVLDLSSPRDIGAVAARLGTQPCHP